VSQKYRTYLSVAAHSEQEGCLLFTNQVLVEVDALLAVVSRWRRKTRMNTGDKA
jgi:hypothetical protein